ncbi:MAG: AAA family ATPase [Burkholderiaceae bacterium]
MYLTHFGLRELPFVITPDTAYAFRSRSHQRALNTLLVALQLGEGFIKIVGEVGTGKTLLCRRFLAKLPEGTVSAYIPNPALRPRPLLFALTQELRIPVPARATEYDMRLKLEAAMIEHAHAGRRVVICLDEAQTIPSQSLEILRLLSNLETEKSKMMQLVMFGQPELDRRLAKPSVRQLRQRIAFSYRMRAMSEEEVDAYVEHRLRVAGREGARVFTPQATRILHAASGGVPRLVNILANKSLMLAYGRGVAEVGPREAWLAARDTADSRNPRLYRLPAWAGLGMLSAMQAVG